TIANEARTSAATAGAFLRASCNVETEGPRTSTIVNTRGVDGIAIGPDGGDRVTGGPSNHRILAELPECEVIELRFTPDFEGVDPHTHPDHIDSFYVLDGEAEFVVGDE